VNSQIVPARCDAFSINHGLIIGFLTIKFLKIASIAVVVILIAAYLGFFG